MDRTACDRVTVTVSKPEYIIPAGFVLYQLIRVAHSPSRHVRRTYTDYYAPGTDY